MSRRRVQSVIVIIAVVLGASWTVAAQGGRGMGRAYDPRTEITVRGTVDTVTEETAAPRGRRGAGMPGMTGTHLTLKTESETITVYLGPSAYLAEQKMTLAAGDAIEVLGSRVTTGTESALIAREVAKGASRWTLRDSSGRPLWRGAARRGRSAASL